MKYMSGEEILRERKEYILPCLGHFYKEAPAFVKGEMQYLYDREGKRYLDLFAGVSVMNCGHCNEYIVERMTKQMRELQHVCNIYLTEPMVRLAAKLREVAPKGLRKMFFCNSGSEATEGALLTASIYTGRGGYMALGGGLHGRTKLGMSVTGIEMWRVDEWPVKGVKFAPQPYCYRCPLKLKKETCDLECANRIEGLMGGACGAPNKTRSANGSEVAALIAEPIQGNAGIIVPPAGYFKRVKEILDKHGVLLIVDEVQTGFARTGKMFAIEHFGVEPDLMSVAKALGNGQPIGAFLAREEVANSFTRPSASTLGGNPVSMTAGEAVLEYIEREGLVERARVMGERLKRGLKELQKKHALIGEVRGMGLMIGAEIVNEKGEANAEATDEIVEEMKKQGFIVGKNGIGRNVLAFQPPLVITEKDVDEALNALEWSLTMRKYKGGKWIEESEECALSGPLTLKRMLGLPED